jgi:hypothetical protein
MPTPLSNWLNESSEENTQRDSPADSGIVPFSQRWIYNFYYKYEKNLLPRQKSIIDAVLRGLDDPEQQLRDSTATKKQKIAAVKIIRSVMRRHTHEQ